MSLKKCWINECEEKRRNKHRKLLSDLSTFLLPNLFSDLDINNYEVEHIFREPKGNLPRIGISPDLIIVYNNSCLNLLILEAKASIGRDSLIDLSQELFYLRHFAENRAGAESLHYLLDEKIPLETLQSCGILTAGIYRTGHNGFKIFKTERLR